MHGEIYVIFSKLTSPASILIIIYSLFEFILVTNILHQVINKPVPSSHLVGHVIHKFLVLIPCLLPCRIFLVIPDPGSVGKPELYVDRQRFSVALMSRSSRLRYRPIRSSHSFSLISEKYRRIVFFMYGSAAPDCRWSHSRDECIR